MRAAKIARRAFLIGSAAVAGGVAFGIYEYKRAPENPLLKQLEKGQVALTPYVRIDPTGVTIIAPRADVGQGVASVLAAMVAEELDLAWEDVKVGTAPGAASTQGGAGEACRCRDRHGSDARRPPIADVASKFRGAGNGRLVHVADGYDKMRVAGAAARETLLRQPPRRPASLRPICEHATAP